ncbi:hypothetical protein VTJ49DRAFT_2618 [Mycothermus thermophilus]|uniref:Uncharacterized protein n=1 Tax=Humicola insolens TaxID=85995 RepID=A0ABR3VA32_HUMIN
MSGDPWNLSLDDLLNTETPEQHAAAIARKLGENASKADFIPSPWAGEIIQLKFANNVTYPISSGLLSKCPSLAALVKNGIADLTLHSPTAGHALVHLLHLNEYSPMRPTGVDHTYQTPHDITLGTVETGVIKIYDDPKGIAALKSVLDTCYLARVLQYEALENAAFEDLAVGLWALGPTGLETTIKATFPRPLSEDPVFEAELKKFVGDWDVKGPWRVKPVMGGPPLWLWFVFEGRPKDWEFAVGYQDYAKTLREAYINAKSRYYWSGGKGW